MPGAAAIERLFSETLGQFAPATEHGEQRELSGPVTDADYSGLADHRFSGHLRRGQARPATSTP